MSKLSCKSIFFLIILSLASGVAGAQSELIKEENIELELVSDRQAIKAMEPFWIGLRLKPGERAHVYWKNPGDSGMAPKLVWKTLSGLKVDEVLWPFPDRIPFGHLVNYGYARQTFLLTKANLPVELSESRQISIVAHVEWIVCIEECVPGEGDLSLELPVEPNGDFQPSRWAAPMQEEREKLPLDMNWSHNSAKIEGENLIWDLQSDTQSIPTGNLFFFPITRQVIENAAPQKFEISDKGLRLILKTSRNRQKPAEISGILLANNGWPATDGAKAVHITSKLEVTGFDNGEAQSWDFEGNSKEQNFSWFILLSAFLGGIILNFMPCVFPVLSIKVLHFSEKAKEDTSMIRFESMIFTIGVLFGFWLLALLLMMIKHFGVSLGWGFQLQYPEFISALIFVLLFMALNLFGAFEVGSGLQNLAGKVSGKRESARAFFNGLLVTLLATPCTAPFMGIAIAVALTQSSIVAFLIFSMLGLGMAFPYLLLSWLPFLHSMLPRPGSWMVHFKHLMALPLLGTVFWLVWVFEKQRGIEGLNRLIIATCLFVVGIFVYGKVQYAILGKLVKRIMLLLVIVLCAGAYVFSISGNTASQTKLEASTDDYGLYWETFSPERLRKYQLEGRSVFLDFTASWCITCQVNKVLTFSSAQVQKRLSSGDVVLLRADWTNKDPEIAKQIESYGRSGVPLNVLHPKDPSKKPVIFPALLSPGIFVEIFDKAQS
ncbi:MAG: hypothetical protein GYA55_00940 [SAR324 cluster bacterium]|uniref:Thiol:disulfide interchange protein DsbD N-terminal domain-containing protein n=1 Tax=SAR324 cluster bacterium TaxID=2024889 RepID=A0A7X9FP91_9DELT|nr:hypothetical protein [SAR324 cluster bacterium]